MGKVVINLTSGPEDPESSTIAYLVGTAAQTAGHDVLFFMTKEAVRFGLVGGAEAVEAADRPRLADLAHQFAERGGEIYLCPVCFTSRGLDENTTLPNARVAGAGPLWEWAGEGTTALTY